MADEIGRAKIVVEADTEGVKASISDAKVEVESLGDSAAAAGDKASSAFSAAGDAIESKTAGVRKFQGAISGAVGAVTGMVGVVTSLVGVMVLLSKTFVDTRGKGDEFGNEINAIRKAVEDFDKALEVDPNLRTRYDIEEMITDSKRLTVEQRASLLDQVRTARLRNELTIKEEETQKRLIKLREQEDQILFAREDRRKNAVLELQGIERAFDLELTDDPVEKARKESDLRRESLERLIERANFTDDERAKKLLSLEDELSQRRIENARSELDRKIAAEKEAADRQAKAIASALERELASVTQSLFGTGGNNITTNMQTIVKELRNLQSDLRGLK